MANGGRDEFCAPRRLKMIFGAVVSHQEHKIQNFQSHLTEMLRIPSSAERRRRAKLSMSG